MRRFDMLPSYHFEDSVNGIIESPAEPDMRDYVIEGNCGKNLIPYPYANTTKTVNGITFTDNGDGSITINGTNTGTGALGFYLYQNNKMLIPKLNIGEAFTLSAGGEMLPDGVNIVLNYWDSSPKQCTGKTLNKNSASVSGTVGENWNGIFLYITVTAGTTADNLVVRPQLELGTAATEYEPYKAVGDETENGKYKLTVVVGGKNELVFSSEALTFTKIIDRKADIPAGRYLLSWSSCVLGGDSSPVLRFHANNVNKWLIKTGDCHLVTFTQPENRTMMYSNGYSYDNSKGITSTVNQLMLQDITNLPNLIPYPYFSSTKTEKGITYTDNGDGSITVNGTNNIDETVVFYKILEKTKLSVGTYVLTGCPSGGSTSSFSLMINFYDENDAALNSLTVHDIGKGAVKYFSENYNIRIYIRIAVNATVENLVFKPKLVKVSTDYEPYIAPTTTNIIRDNPLKPGESINYRADKLPSVTLKKNVTNTVKVDTEIQPKSVKWQYYTY